MDEADDERVKRISERFNLIKQTITELTDADTAFAVSAVAYLEGIQYTALCGLHRVQKHALEYGGTDTLVQEMYEAVKGALKGFHRHLCDHFGLDQADIINRSSAFKEIVNDICKQRG